MFTPRLLGRGSALSKVAAALALVGGIALAGSDATASSPTSVLTASASTVANGADITFAYSTPAATASSTNWVGIYEPGQVPGQVGSTTWQYTPGTAGTVSFTTSSLDGV